MIAGCHTKHECLECGEHDDPRMREHRFHRYSGNRCFTVTASTLLLPRGPIFQYRFLPRDTFGGLGAHAAACGQLGLLLSLW